MNKKITILLGLLCLASTCWAYKIESKTIPEDTVIIEVGDSKIVIIVNSIKDLENLENFEINQMIADLSLNISEDSVQRDQIVLSDSLGNTYQKEEDLVYYGDTDEEDNDFFDSWDGDLKWGKNLDNEEDEEESNPIRTSGSFNIDLGMNNWLQKGAFPDDNDELYTIKPLGSWYVALGHTNHTRITGPLRLDWGGNVSWYNWKLENRDVRIIKGDDETLFVQDAAVDGQKSKLVGTYLNVNAVPMIDLGKPKKDNDKNYFGDKYDRKGFRIGLGGYAGYRIDSWTKFVYEEGGDKKKDKQRGNYFLSNFRYGIRGVVGYKAMDLFVNYDLNTVFADNRGPKINAVSFGIIL